MKIDMSEWERQFSGEILPDKIIEVLSESLTGPIWGSLKNQEANKNENEKGVQVSFRIPESLNLRIAYRKESNPRYKWASDVVRHWIAVGVYMEEILDKDGYYESSVETDIIERRLYEKMKTLERQYAFVDRLDSLVRTMLMNGDHQGIDDLKIDARAYYAAAASDVVRQKVRRVFPDIGD